MHGQDWGRGRAEGAGFGRLEARVLDVERNHLHFFKVDAWLVEYVSRRNRQAQGPVEGDFVDLVDSQRYLISRGVDFSVFQLTKRWGKRYAG